MADLLRCTASFTEFNKAVEVHLVEVSAQLAQTQGENLTDTATSLGKQQGEHALHEFSVDSPPSVAGWPSTADSSRNHTKWGPQVHWHADLSEVPQDAPSLFLAHEFFDALPVHQFRKTEDRGWVELLVDIDERYSSEEHFQMVLSPRATVLTQLLVPFRLKGMSEEQASSLKGLELSAKAIAIVRQIASRVANAAHPSAALIIDYGDEGPFGHSLQVRTRTQIGQLARC